MPPKLPPQAAIADAERDEILRRHRAGESRNGIARAVGRSGATVTKVVKADGGNFVRAPEIAAATEAGRIDLAAERLDLAIRLHRIAVRELDRMTMPQKYHDWGGAEHDFDVQEMAEPTPADRKALVQAAATAIDRSLKLCPPKDDPAEAARSMVGTLMAGLAQVYSEQQLAEAAGDAE